MKHFSRLVGTLHSYNGLYRVRPFLWMYLETISTVTRSAKRLAMKEYALLPLGSGMELFAAWMIGQWGALGHSYGHLCMPSSADSSTKQRRMEGYCARLWKRSKEGKLSPTGENRKEEIEYIVWVIPATSCPLGPWSAYAPVSSPLGNSTSLCLRRLLTSFSTQGVRYSCKRPRY